MHWTKFFVEDEPELGDERVRSGFLWLPKAVRDETRWLVHATWRERYVWTRLGRGREVKAWRGVEWVDEDEQHQNQSVPSIDPHSAEDRFAEAVLRGASRIEVRSGDGSSRVQVEAYERAGEEGGHLVVERAGEWAVDQTDDADAR